MKLYISIEICSLINCKFLLSTSLTNLGNANPNNGLLTSSTCSRNTVYIMMLVLKTPWDRIKAGSLSLIIYIWSEYVHWGFNWMIRCSLSSFSCINEDMIIVPFCAVISCNLIYARKLQVYIWKRYIGLSLYIHMHVCLYYTITSNWNLGVDNPS